MANKYDFETLVDRSGTGSVKWDAMRRDDPEVPAGVAPLSIGDMELKTPPELVDGLKEYLDTAILGYTAPTPADRRAATEWFRRRHGWEVEADWLVGIDGIVPALYLAVRALTDPGDCVVYMPPVYRPMYNAVNDGGRRPVAAPLLWRDGVCEMDFAALERALAVPDVTMLLLCSPHNPVGRVWRREELARLGELCRANGVLVVSDEIHMDFVMPGHRHVPYTEAGDAFAAGAIICTAPSKTFNIAGLQTSNLVIPDPDLRRRFAEAYRRTGRHGVNQLGLAACRLAYERCGDWLDGALELVHGNGVMLREFMRSHYPEVAMHDHQGTYFAWLDFRAWGVGPEELRRFMTRRARLFLDEGSVFGSEGDGFERFNLACPRWVLRDALERLLRAGRPVAQSIAKK